MKNPAKTIDEYLQNVSKVRSESFEKLYSTVRENIPADFQETITYGMRGWVVPHTLYPKGYHCDPSLPLPFISIASQKNFIAIYHRRIYTDKKLLYWFVSEYPKHAKYKLDMGESCVRFKKVSDILFVLIAELTRKISAGNWIKLYEKNLIN